MCKKDKIQNHPSYDSTFVVMHSDNVKCKQKIQRTDSKERREQKIRQGRPTAQTMLAAARECINAPDMDQLLP